MWSDNAGSFIPSLASLRNSTLNNPGRSPPSVPICNRSLLAAGASDTLAKPASPRKLIGCVRALLDPQFATETNATTPDHLRCLVACGA